MMKNEFSLFLCKVLFIFGFFMAICGEKRDGLIMVVIAGICGIVLEDKKEKNDREN